MLHRLWTHYGRRRCGTCQLHARTDALQLAYPVAHEFVYDSHIHHTPDADRYVRRQIWFSHRYDLRILNRHFSHSTLYSPVAFLTHGLAGHRRNWRAFCRELTMLNRKYQIALIDLRGHGIE